MLLSKHRGVFSRVFIAVDMTTGRRGEGIATLLDKPAAEIAQFTKR
jgi:hypothetical protein